MSKIIEELEAEQMEREIPKFSPGDTVVVQVRVREGNRERMQAYEGVVIAKRNRGLNSSFTVRKVSHGEGVERVFQTYSPAIGGIKVKRILYFFSGGCSSSLMIRSGGGGGGPSSLGGSLGGGSLSSSIVVSPFLLGSTNITL